MGGKGVRVVELIGRDLEVSQLLATMERVLDGEPSVTVIEGEPGIGKTRLVDELIGLASIKGCRVLVCRCGELDRDHPFVPIVAALQDLLADLGIEAPVELHDAVAILRSATTANLPANEVQPRGDYVTSLIVESIHEIARTAPLLVAFEDLQWVDEASSRVLWGLARRRRGSRILTAVTLRPTKRALVDALRRGLDGQGATSLALSPLDPASALRLASAVAGFGKTVDSALVNDAAGNPLFLTELFRDTSDSAHPHARAHEEAESPRIPATLRAPISRRLSGLPPATSTLLADAALFGSVVDLGELGALTGLSAEALGRTLAPAIEEGVVADDDRGITFQHGIVQTIVAEQRSVSLRRGRHEVIAAMLEQRGLTPRAAEHLWLSKPAPSTSAVAMMTAAANEVRLLSFESALSWFERAITLAPDPPTRFDLGLEVARLLILVGRLDDAYALCATPEMAPQTLEQEVRVREIQTSLTMMLGLPRSFEAEAHVQWLMENQAHHRWELPDLLGSRAILALMRGEFDAAEALAKQALASPVTAASSYSRANEAMGLVLLIRGDIVAAQGYTSEALRQFVYDPLLPTAVMMPHYSRALSLISSDPISSVMSVLREGFAICDRAGHSLARIHLEPVMGVAQFAAGDLASQGGYCSLNSDSRPRRSSHRHNKIKGWARARWKRADRPFTSTGLEGSRRSSRTGNR